METRLVRHETWVALLVSGRLDMTSASVLEERLEELIGRGERRVALDFSGLAYLSSAGLRSILVAAKRLREAGGHLVVIGLNGPVKEVFDMSGLGGVLPNFAGERELATTLPEWA